jgi:hypothetical protein
MLLCIEQNQSAYIFFTKSEFFFFELHWVHPYHALNSKFANFETPVYNLFLSILLAVVQNTVRRTYKN